MKRITLLIGFLCLAGSNTTPQSLTPRHATGPNQNLDDDIARIAGYAVTRGGAYQFLQSLTDDIGARVTGSPQSQAASELILKTLKEAGFETAHFEEYPFQPRWQRGPASGQVVSPANAPLHVGSYAWVPGTPERIEVPLIDLGTPSTNDLPKTVGSLLGAAVIVDVHSVGNAPTPVMRARVAKQLSQAGAAAMLIPSDKPDRMLYTSAYGFYPRGPLPVLSVAKEDTLYLRRLLSHGPVKIALNIRNSFDDHPASERNVIAEIPGMNSDEITLLGAHFDSWDPAQGADDNGTGVAALLEAARVLKLSGVKPRTSIRFAFFSGEEEANLGSRAYVERHKGELDRHRAFLLMDDGAQAPRGFRTNGREDVATSTWKVLQPLAALGVSTVSTGADMESDNASFMVAGVPSLTLMVEPGDYDIRHHAVTDTFDKIDARILAWDTAVMAITAYLIADEKNPLGHQQSLAEVRELLRKTGLESAQEMQFGPLKP